MKVCAPVKDQLGLDSHLSEHFGSAPYYIVVDTDSMAFEVQANKSSQHHHGNCHIISRLKRRGVEGIIANTLGRGVFYKAKDQNTKIYKSQHETIRSAIHALLDESLHEMNLDEACRHHHGDHAHHNCSH